MATITAGKPVRVSIALACILFFSIQAWAQNEVAIGSASTKSNAILWLNGNGSQGLILPVVTNKSSVVNPDKGMIVYDDSDNKVWYRNNSAWVEVGAGGGASLDNLNLLIQGNQLQLRDGTTVLGSENIAGGTQANGAFLVFQDGSWQFATLGGDVTGANGALQVTGLRGKPIATLPATAQVLAYDPAANSGNGGWEFRSLAAAGGILNVSGTAPVTVANPTTTPTISIADGGITNTLLADNAITTGKIQDGTITGADIANSTITADKLAQSGATDDQVLQWNGTNWVPASLASSGTVTEVSTGNGLTGGPITNTGTISIAPGGVTATELANVSVSTTKLADNAVTTIKINANAVDNTKLADNAVTSGKIADGTITGADIAANTIAGSNIITSTISADKLAPSGATPGQVLKWNGTNWVPQADDTDSGSLPALTNAQLITNNGTSNIAVTMSGDASFSATGSLTINDNVITANKISANAVDATKLVDNAVTAAKINSNAVDATKLADNAVTSTKIADGTITGADVATTTITTDKLAQSGANTNEVLQWNGTNWVPAALVAGGTVSQINTGTGLTGGPITTTGTISIAPGGVNTTELANNAVDATRLADNAVTTSKITANAVDVTKLADNAVNSAKIVDASISGADIAPTTITGSNIANTTITADKLAQSSAAVGQVLKWNGTNWIPQADDAGTPLPALTAGQLITHNGTTNVAVTMSGDATFSQTGALTVANNAITTAKINNGAVDATKLADNAVTTAKINANAVDATKIADNAVTTAKINANAVDNTKLADNSVTSAKIADGEITNADISATAAIEVSKLAAGTDNHVLTTVAGVPTWQSSAGWSLTGNAGTNPATNFLGTTDAQDLIFKTANNEGFRLTQTGWLGFGTSTPISKMDIRGPNTDDGAILAIGNSDISHRLLIFPGRQNDPNPYIQVKAGDPLRFATDENFFTETMRIESNGNVGIGTTTPVYKLDVNGIASASQARIGTQPWADNPVLWANQPNNPADPGAGAFNATITHASNPYPAGSFWTQGTGPSLNVDWAGTVSNQLVTYKNFGILVGDIKTDGGAWFNGDVGIGIAAPTAKLEVAGQVKITGGVPGAGKVLTSDADGLASWEPADVSSVWGLAGNSGTDPATNFLGTSDLQALSIRTNDTERMRIASNGFVGFGIDPDSYATTNDAAHIELARSGQHIRFRMTSSFTHRPAIQINATDGTDTRGWSIYRNNNTDGSLIVQANDGINGVNGEIVAMNIAFQTGNVGIKKALADQATEALDVNGNVRFSGALMPNNLPGSAGQVLTSAGPGTPPVWQAAGAGSGWSLLGNGGLSDATNFIGTTDNVPLNIRVANVRAGRIEMVSPNGNANTFFGFRSGLVNAGTNNVAFGANSMDSNTSGSNNAAFGYNAMEGNTTGNDNTALGHQALKANTTAGGNTAVGRSALFTQSFDIGVGLNTFNTAVGYQALYFNQPTGTNDAKWNTAIGYLAGETNTTGARNTFLGANANGSTGTLTNATAIGEGTIVNASNKVRIGNTSVAVVEGQVPYSNASDRRLKKNIQDLSGGIDLISKLRPVSYQMKSGDDRLNWGFIAQEIEDIVGTENAVLTVGEDEERHLSLRYTDFIAPMVKAIQEQQEQIEHLKTQLQEKDDKVIALESSVNSMKSELEAIKQALGLTAKKQ
jgi:hypothetical protein